MVDKTGALLGRPWLSIVVDTYSRCVMGMHCTNLLHPTPAPNAIASTSSQLDRVLRVQRRLEVI